MAIPVICDKCRRKLRAPDRAAGRAVKCSHCGSIVRVPPSGSEPEDPRRAWSEKPRHPSLSSETADSRSATQSDGQSKPLQRSDTDEQHSRADENDRNDLSVTTKYEPSGRCGRPWMIVPLIPVGIFIIYLGEGLGLFLGAIAGFIGVGIPGMLLDQFGITQYFTDGNTMRLMGANVGSTLGGYFGLFVGAVCSGGVFNRLAHNRSGRIALIFSTTTIVLSLSPYFVYSGEIIRELKEASPSFAAYYWLVVAGLVFFGALGALGSTLAGLESPYCETCNSYLKQSMRREFPTAGSHFMEMVKSGAVRPMTRMKQRTNDDKTYTAVALDQCRKGCCTYIRIASYRLFFDKQQQKEIERMNLKAEGFLDSRRAETWTRILNSSEA